MLVQDTESFEFVATEHLRMSGIYWGITAMALMGRLDDMDNDKIVKFVIDCQSPSGGFGGNLQHDPHLLYTLSAVCLISCAIRYLFFVNIIVM